MVLNFLASAWYMLLRILLWSLIYIAHCLMVLGCQLPACERLPYSLEKDGLLNCLIYLDMSGITHFINV